ncbi:SET and MYND domain-containing protein 4 [Diachasma alloeum]|uniref:SET and MYND domain-containing protein 4 n=1 Tax=Diachasma alloeum TaxID=454923 RepID=UPI0007384C14|nr:SET and MYND domain-containing protein 4 [Diachasma alloeum]
MQWETFLQAIHRKLRSTNSKEQIYKSKTESEVISLISKNHDVVDLISSWLDNQCKHKSSKSSKCAKKFKDIGNDSFKRRDYIKSLSSYTESAKFSSVNRDDFSVAVANRSASLFHMCRYKECLEDLEVAIEAGYPRKLVYKVHLRAAQCYIKLRKSEAAEDEIRKARDVIVSDESLTATVKETLLKQVSALSLDLQKISPSTNLTKNDPPEVITPEKLIEINANFPSASPSMTRDHSPTRGRFITATKPIKKGEILFVEKPFAFVPLDHETSNLVCGNCCGRFSDISYPCRGCVEVSYCSPKCWKESWGLYHRWECPGYEMGIWRQIGIAHLAIKVLLVSATTEDIEKFNEVQKLVTNIEKLSDDDLMVYSITALMLSQYLHDHTDFQHQVDLKKSIIEKLTNNENGVTFKISTLSEKRKFLASLLLRHILQLIANGHAITQLNLMNTPKGNIVDEQQQRIAVGIYPSVSMMNHSCDPTIMNTFWNDYLIVKSMKDVGIGDEIFNCYGPHFRRMSVEERQRALKSQYCFQCKCLSCTDTDLQCFLDRFTAFKCSSCSGPLTPVNKAFSCLDCHNSTKIDVASQTKDLETAQDLFASSQDLLDLEKFEESKKKLLQCLNIRMKILFRHHEDVAITLDSLGKVSVIMGQWLEAISYLEDSIITVEEKFGGDSIEVANELNKITDVCIQYLQKDMNRRSEIYKGTLKKTQRFLDRAEEITNLISGPWDSACMELREKKEELEGMYECLHI